jgi:hypothetical protein
MKQTGAVRRDDRLIIEHASETGAERLQFFERILASISPGELL